MKMFAVISLFIATASLGMAARQHCVVKELPEPCMTGVGGEVMYCWVEHTECKMVFPFAWPGSAR